MPRTGRQYGLASNAMLDERSDPEKATRAAAKHLAYLHDLFHDWFLALAAYNAGEGRILRAMEKTGLNDFWQLGASGILKPQTVNYVPAVIAATLISKNPAHYGFDIEYEKPLEYETVVLDRPVRLRHLTASERVSLEDLQQLNPELRTEVTPRQGDGYFLKVPVGTREVVEAAYAEAPTAKPVSYRRHVARKNETLASIAKRYRVAVADVAAVNDTLPRTGHLRKGQVVVIPSPEVATVAGDRKGKKSKAVDGSKSPKEPAVASAHSRRYRVRGGDTLFRIAKKNGTTVEQLMSANSLSSATEIRPGDTIRIPTGSTR
jgi:membrane-bound lytic murein transglycosylase D